MAKCRISNTLESHVRPVPGQQWVTQHIEISRIQPAVKFFVIYFSSKIGIDGNLGTCLMASAWNWLRMISSFISYGSSFPWLWRDAACDCRDDWPRFESVEWCPSVYGMPPCAVACVGDFGLTKHASSDSSVMIIDFTKWIHKWKIDTRLIEWSVTLLVSCDGC